MKKAFSMLLAVVMLACCFSGCAKQAETPAEVPAVPFEVGTDKTEYVVDGSAGWTSYPVYVKIVAGDEVLFNGTVTLTSDNMFVSEITFAAITEKGLSSDGVQVGFINSIGDYVAGNDAEGNYMYWGYTVNGKYVNFACNQMRALEGDYILWEFQKYDETATPASNPSGITAPFEVGTDTAEYVVDGSAGWTSYPVNVKIVAGEDVLFNGTVTLTSDNMFASEATFAAITEKGLSSDGVQVGFINSIGDYVAGNDANGTYMYWGYTVNGKAVNFACNQMSLLEGDYLLWEFQAYEG
jgi:hypothetical protein